jgi:CheY-like chemotaxis protein
MAPVDEATFRRYVEEALAHASDQFYLQLHPLGGLLATDVPSEARGRRLGQLLVQAIELLKPTGSAAPGESVGWRKYRYLRLRYLEGHPAEQVSAVLGLSERQARRDHRQALDALHAILWERHRAASAPDGDDLAAELARLSAAAPPVPTELARLVPEVVATVRPLAEQRGRRLELALAALPPVSVSPVILRQVLIGLLTVAADEAVGDPVRLATETTPRGCRVRVAFAARPEAAEAELMDSARRLAELNGASVRVEAGDGRVTATLDLVSLRPTTVLVVDDNPDLGQLFQRYLGPAYRVVQTADGAEAGKLALRERVDAVTLDVMMPTLDGWELLRRLRADPATADLPVVVCSVLREPSLARALGASAFVAKPVSPQLLRSAIEACRPPAP